AGPSSACRAFLCCKKLRPCYPKCHLESASLISDSDGNEMDEARPVACGSPWGCIIMEQDPALGKQT
ncbi:MAG: hypothetical protein II397_10285, partial [Treponema sp.]|nr:hypothetical protein [Treponema sp.]